MAETVGAHRVATLIRELPGRGRSDISRLLRSASALREAVEALAVPFMHDRVDLVAGLDAAGLPFATGREGLT